MKKDCKTGEYYSPGIWLQVRKILITMKLTLFMILISLFSLQAIVYSQNTKLNLDYKDATVKEILNAIEDQSEFRFAFSSEYLDLDRKVSVQFEKESIPKVLDQIFKDTNIKYSINKHVIILHNENESSNKMIQQKSVSGKVSDSSGEPLPGVSIIIQGTTTGTVTDYGGNFRLSSVPANATLVFSFVGMKSLEVSVEGKSVFDIVMEEDAIGVDEVVVVGYGTQKKSDITGTVASLPTDRLDMVPNTNVSQAIQGAISGIQIQTRSAGAASDNDDTAIMIRGRNSITATNSPLIVVDGFPYSGQLRDINPNDIQSIEILKDASSAAIYGSRGANGVILITTKLGKVERAQISYDGYYSVQEYADFPDFMTGEEFYQFKLDRKPSEMTQTEEDIYNAGNWSDWSELALRTGQSQQHNLSVTGGNENTKFYISGNILDIKGLAVNDKLQRISNRINIETKITEWLTLGTRTALSYTDKSGIAPDFEDIAFINPLTRAYDEDGSLAIYPNKENPFWGNPLAGTIAENNDISYQVVSNNFLKLDLPFVPSLQYTLNAGIRKKFDEDDLYWGRDTKRGFERRGDAETSRAKYSSITLENIINYTKEFEKHRIFVTGLYSYEEYEFSRNRLDAQGFPNDVLKWYGSAQADLPVPSFSYSESNLISQMLRVNYSYDNKYLLTLTGRRDGFSGFGADTKWGEFPSVALGWNIANESFFPYEDIVNNLKLRVSWGKNGNQAVGAYRTISRMRARNWVSGSTTLPGYITNRLGLENLGWETTESFNIGLDFGLLNNRITGDINVYRNKTSDLLLRRTISGVHGVVNDIDDGKSFVTQNIGKTQNSGIEFSVNSTNINSGDFKWSTNANFSHVKNKIVSLYGFLDDEGNEIDDLVNRWFIDEPIRVNYGYKVIGVWQQDEADEAAKYGSQPGFVKLLDTDDDGDIDSDDRMIIGQRDPKVLWGLTNTFEYRNFVLNVFVHGVHGVTKSNPLLRDEVWTDVSRNTVKKNWWTPDNPTNEYYMNAEEANVMGGGSATYYENASFVRIKDISLAYNLPKSILSNIGLKRLRIYVTGRNLFTITNYGGMDPELNNQRAIPLQKEYVIGLNIGL